MLLFVLFILALEGSDIDHINVSEGFFMVYALGFSLEKLASIQEHGLKGAPRALSLSQVYFIFRAVYVNGTWNGFDVLFSTCSTSARGCILKFSGSFGIRGLLRSPVMGNISFR